MKVVIATRNGEVKLRVPAEVRNGILRNNGGILINADLIPAGQKDRVIAQIKAKKITPEIEAMGMILGDNGNGLIVRWAEDVAKEEDAKREAAENTLPADVRAAREARNAIDQLYARSYQSLHYDIDDCNVMRGYSLRAEADTRLKAWRIKYPDAAREEAAKDLEAKAAKQDDLASGALTYDADGWISSEEQQKRYDEFKQKADQLRLEAKKLREGN